MVGARAANLAFPHRGLDGGETLDLGGLTLEAIATPGHTPEHLSYLLRDGAVPLALFSGGALLPGSVARTDLIAPDQTEPLARALYRSLHDRDPDPPRRPRGVPDPRRGLVLLDRGDGRADHDDRPGAGGEPAARRP